MAAYVSPAQATRFVGCQGREFNPSFSALLHGNLTPPQLLLVTWVLMTNVKCQTFSPKAYCPAQSLESEVGAQHESKLLFFVE